MCVSVLFSLDLSDSFCHRSSKVRNRGRKRVKGRPEIGVFCFIFLSFYKTDRGGRKQGKVCCEHEMNPYILPAVPLLISGVRRDSADTEKTTCFPYTYLFNCLTAIHCDYCSTIALLIVSYT